MGTVGTYRVVVDEWWELWVRHDPVERAIQLRRCCALNLEMVDLALKTTGFHETRELGQVREGLTGWRLGAAEVPSHFVYGEGNHSNECLGQIWLVPLHYWLQGSRRNRVLHIFSKLISVAGQETCRRRPDVAPSHPES